MASRYYPRERRPLPRVDDSLFESSRMPDSPPAQQADSGPHTILEPALSLPLHDGQGAFASPGYPSPMTDSTHYSLSSSLRNSVAARSNSSNEYGSLPQAVTPDETTSSWQDIGTLSNTGSRGSEPFIGVDPSADIWQWTVNSSRISDESWVSPSFPSALSPLSRSLTSGSQSEPLEMSIRSEEWRRVQARSRVISSSAESRAEAEAFLVRRRLGEGSGPSQETLWEALLRRLLTLDGATMKMLNGESGSIFFEGQEAPLLNESHVDEEASKRPQQEHALTAFLSHVASSLSPAAALKRGLSVLPVRATPLPATPVKAALPDSNKEGRAAMAAGVAWYILSALPLLISLEAGGRVWRVWRMVQEEKA